MINWHCGIDYDAVWDMPVAIRKWWWERMMKERKAEEARKGIQTDDPRPIGPRQRGK